MDVVVGDMVAWRWAAGVAEGVVEDIVPERLSIESKGKIITRNGTPENPAVVIRHTGGSTVLKLKSELQG